MRSLGRQRSRTIFVYTVILLLAWIQIYLVPRPLDPTSTGAWFLYGRDTLAHDAIVQLWIAAAARQAPGVIPLWMPELQGGLPTIGAFLWTPLAPMAWPFLVLDFAQAQRLAWFLTLVVAGLGGRLLGRTLGLQQSAALVAGVAWMLAGHLVTLIHAGHFQKVMALAWFPWMLAGAIIVARLRLANLAASGAAIMAVGLGMMVLCGHPQIAWLGIVSSAWLVLWFLVTSGWSWPLRLRRAALAFVAGGFGLLVASPQLLPGIEMSGVSNRAGGVSFEEAVATSYPPGELMEFVLPRWKGSSVFGDVYRGEWGERIVSDHAGIVFVLLAVAGILTGGWRRMTPLLVLAMFFLIVGLGRHTPLYSLLYASAPGFGSFRSPGTFFAAPALMLALLAGLGTSAILDKVRRARWQAIVVAAVLLVGSAQLMHANRHFLLRFSWEQYQREFVLPNELDLWLEDSGAALGVHDIASDLSLRPILFGRRSLRGYHPISFAARLSDDEKLGYNTREWFEANAVQLVLIPPGVDHQLPTFPAQRRSVMGLDDIRPIVWMVVPNEWRWIERSGGRRILEVNSPGGTLRLRETEAPGMLVLIDGALSRRVDAVAVQSLVQLPPGKVQVAWQYRPFSWRSGLFLGALGLIGVGFLIGYSKRAVPTRTMVAPSSTATS